MSKKQITGTARQLQCNRKFCQFNKDQYCNGLRKGNLTSSAKTRHMKGHLKKQALIRRYTGLSASDQTLHLLSHMRVRRKDFPRFLHNLTNTKVKNI